MHSSWLRSFVVAAGSAWRWLDGHFGAKKTDDILAGHFFWPKMRRDVERFVARCTTCQKG